MNTTCPDCTHDPAEHSAIAGCLADGCTCENGPVVATFAPPARDLTEGRRRRDEGAQAAGSAAPGALVADWRLKAEAALKDLIASGAEFDADDLVERVGMPPVANMVGGVFIGASRAKRIRAVGYSQGTRPASHARVQRTWVGA